MTIDLLSHCPKVADKHRNWIFPFRSDMPCRTSRTHPSPPSQYRRGKNYSRPDGHGHGRLLMTVARWPGRRRSGTMRWTSCCAV
jgi:hypothetical protein